MEEELKTCAACSREYPVRLFLLKSRPRCFLCDALKLESWPENPSWRAWFESGDGDSFQSVLRFIVAAAPSQASSASWVAPAPLSLETSKRQKIAVHSISSQTPLNPNERKYQRLLKAETDKLKACKTGRHLAPRAFFSTDKLCNFCSVRERLKREDRARFTVTDATRDVWRQISNEFMAHEMHTCSQIEERARKLLPPQGLTNEE